MHDKQRSHLDDLCLIARNDLLPLASTGREITAIGEFLEALELWLDGESGEISVNVEVGVACGGGDGVHTEHLHAYARANCEFIELSTLHRTYSVESGSDHHSEILAELTSSSGFDFRGFERWREIFNRVRSSDSLELTISRDHM